MGGAFIYSDPPEDTILGQEREGFNRFVAMVADAVGIPLAVLMSRQRNGRVVALRQFLMAVARLELEWTFHRVGEYFGRDHATVVHAVRQVTDRIEVNQLNMFEIQCAVACDAASRVQYQQSLKFLAPCLTTKKSL